MKQHPRKPGRWTPFWAGWAIIFSLMAAVSETYFRVYQWPILREIPLLGFPEVLFNLAALSCGGIWLWLAMRKGNRKALIMPALLLVFVGSVAVATSFPRWNLQRAARERSKMMMEELRKSVQEMEQPEPVENHQ